MNVHIVLAHPEPSSFNGQLGTTAFEHLTTLGHRVTLTDLYSAGFCPAEGPDFFRNRKREDHFEVQIEQEHAYRQNCLDEFVASELDRLRSCDLLILQYPTWWFMPPAMMKGWVDRVLVYGATYNSRSRYDRGLLSGRRAMLSVTFGGAESTFAYNGRNGDVELLLWPMQMSLAYVGFEVMPPFRAFSVDGDAARLATLRENYRQHLSALGQMDPIPFNGWNDWDETGRLKPEAMGHSLFMRAIP